MYNVKKGNRTKQELRAYFYEHCSQHQNTLKIYTDGSKTSEGVGHAYSYEGVITSKKIPVYSSIFSAELLAIRDSVALAKSNHANNITIFTDSRSSILAISKYNNKNPIVQSIQHTLNDIDGEIKLCWVPSHVGVIGNENVDEAARNIISNNTIENVNLPRSDFKCLIKKNVKEKWRNEWANLQNNKLRDMKDNVHP